MRYEIADPFDDGLRAAELRQETHGERAAFRLLKPACGVAVFGAAKRAGDVMHDGGKLKRLLDGRVQAFQAADRFGVGIYFKK